MNIVVMILLPSLIGQASSFTHETDIVENGQLFGVANIRPDSSSNPKQKVTGIVYITQESKGSDTRFRIVLRGLKPNSLHGFHVHEYGDIVTRGCRSTGGHYNPFNKLHGDRHDIERHVGDLGNIRANRKGEVDITFADHVAGLFGHHSIYGRAFVVHRGQDDLGRGTGANAAGSRRTGNAGPRLACGVIVHANKKAILSALHDEGIVNEKEIIEPYW